MIRALSAVSVPLIAALSCAQSPSLAIVAEPWGPSCGPELADGARTLPAVRGFGLSVAGARPNTPLVLLLGERAAEVPLPSSPCHLLTVPMAALPLHADADGRAEVTCPLPFLRPGSLYAQVVQLGAATESLVGSGGLALHAVPTEHTDALLLARVQTNGTRVQFFQQEPGELLVVASGASAVPAPLAQLGAGRMTAVEAYEALSGQRAPLVLRSAADAAARARKPAQAGAAAHGAGASPALSGPPLSPSSCLSASWFRSNHCGGDSDFEYCWTDITGNPWVQRDCHGIWGVTACLSGSYVFECRYHDAWGWHTTYSTTVQACEWYYAYNSGLLKRDRRVHVLYGTGNLQHFSVRGFN